MTNSLEAVLLNSMLNATAEALKAPSVDPVSLTNKEAMTYKIHVTRQDNGDIFGHRTVYCGDSGCNGQEAYWGLGDEEPGDIVTITESAGVARCGTHDYISHRDGMFCRRCNHLQLITDNKPGPIQHHMTKQTIRKLGQTMTRDVRQIRADSNGYISGYVTIAGSRQIVFASCAIGACRHTDEVVDWHAPTYVGPGVSL